MQNRFNNKRYTQISLYVIAVAAAIIAIFFFIDNISYFLDGFWNKVDWVLSAATPIIWGCIFAYLLDPVVCFFERILCKIKFFDRRRASTKVLCAIFVVVAILLILFGAISLVVFTVTNQIRLANFGDIITIAQGYLDNINELYAKAIEWLNTTDFESDQIESYLSDVIVFIFGNLKIGSITVVSAISNVTSFITTSVIALVITIYLLIDSHTIIDCISKICNAIFSERINKNMRIFINDVNTVFSGYIRGQSLDAMLMAVMISIGLTIIGVDFGAIIGVLAGLANMIPYIGPVVAYGGVIIVSLFTGDWARMIIALIFLLVIQTVDGNIIGPKLLSKNIQVHPLLVICSIVFGSAVGGILGMLLAVPTGALIKVIFMRYIDNRLEKKKLQNMNCEQNAVNMQGMQNVGNVQDMSVMQNMGNAQDVNMMQNGQNISVMQNMENVQDVNMMQNGQNISVMQNMENVQDLNVMQKMSMMQNMQGIENVQNTSMIQNMQGMENVQDVSMIQNMQGMVNTQDIHSK